MRDRRRFLLATLVLAAITIGWLIFTRHPSTEVRRLFGLWHTRHFLVALCLVFVMALCALRAISRGALIRGLALVFVFGLCWSVLEVAGIVGIVSYPRVFGRVDSDTLGATPKPNVNITGRTLPDIAAAWGLPAQPVEFSYTTDRRGFRNVHDREEADIYLLGDSILVAGLVPAESTVAARVESALNRPTMNIALIGLSPQAERDLWRSAKPPMTKTEHGGKLVLHFIFEGNDLGDSSVYRERAAAAVTTGTGKPPRPPVFERTLIRSVELWLIRRTQPVHPSAARFTGDVNGTPYRFLWSGWSMAGHDEELPQVGAAMAEVCEEVRAAGGTYAVVFVPDKLRILGPLAKWPAGSALTNYTEHLSPLPGYLAQWARERSVPLLDTTAALSAAAAAGELPYFPDDTHLNAAGHAALARAIAEWSAVKEWSGKR